VTYVPTTFEVLEITILVRLPADKEAVAFIPPTYSIFPPKESSTVKEQGIVGGFVVG